MLRIGIDLGGTKTEGIVMDEAGKIVLRERLSTPQTDGYDAILQSVYTLVRDLEKILSRPIRIANDANCFALSEAIDGAGRGAGIVFGVILGTGVGGGIVIHGKLHEGPQHIAGEWGHNILEADGPPCYCGKHGCVETFLSGPGLVQDWARHGGGAALAADGPALAFFFFKQKTAYEILA